MNKFSKGGEYHATVEKVWSFFKRHINAETKEDWAVMARELKTFTTPLEVRLAVAIVQEIERNYQCERYGEEFREKLLELELKFISDVYKLID